MQELIRELGGQPDKNVTKKTTILVVGTGAHKGSASRKVRRAQDLLPGGQAIQILEEEEFFRMLAG